MLTGTVVGNIVSTQKHAKLVGYKLLLVELASGMISGEGRLLVVVDTLGAGPGETVIVTTGSSARFSLGGEPPVDAAVVGIVDRVEKG